MRRLGAAQRRQGGLTLIELMVTVLLATLLIGGLFYMMVGQQRTYTAQVNTLSAQENLWGAMEYLERQIRMAGYGFGACGGKILTVGTGDGGVDVIQAMEVHNNHNLWTGNNDQTDSFGVRYSASAQTGAMSVRVTYDHPISSTVLYVNSAGGLSNGDLIVVCLPGYPGTLMELTANPTLGPDKDKDGNPDWILAHNPSSQYNPPNWNGLFGPGAKYPPNTLVAKFGSTKEAMKFAIDNDSNPPRLMTWTLTDKSDAQIVAVGIEDMQISWACDTESSPNNIFTEGVCNASGGGVACKCSVDDCSAKVNDEWAYNVAGDTVPVCGDNLIQRVRITLIARTDAPVIADRKGFRPEAEDHYEGTPADDLAATDNVGTYARATLTSVVVPRNIRLSQL
jgi:hypothetical protein